MLTRTRRVLLVTLFLLSVASANSEVLLPSLQSNLVCRYDFDHPTPTNSAYETDLGNSGTVIELINGRGAMRTNDGAYASSGQSLQTRQVNPNVQGNDDWKAGIYAVSGVPTLNAFASTSGMTLMGWVKPTGSNPSLNSESAIVGDYFNAIGLFGVLSGTSEGHNVRALLEVINVSGILRVVALGRRLDEGGSSTLAASDEWQTILPSQTWTHLTATFNYDKGEMALYRNGQPLEATYTSGGDPWNINGGAEPDLTSPTDPAGIKIAGSYPQNTQERNPFNGQLDDLMFFDRVLSPEEIQMQYAQFTHQPPTRLSIVHADHTVTLSWPSNSHGFSLESNTDLVTETWTTVEDAPATNSESISVTLPKADPQQFFRLKGQ